VDSEPIVTRRLTQQVMRNLLASRIHYPEYLPRLIQSFTPTLSPLIYPCERFMVTHIKQDDSY
jgi:hypothetical protein